MEYKTNLEHRNIKCGANCTKNWANPLNMQAVPLASSIL